MIIGIGDTVVLQDKYGVQSLTLISHEDEFDSKELGVTIITEISPLGQAIVGKTKGCKVTVGPNANTYKIIAVEKGRNKYGKAIAEIHNSWVILLNIFVVFVGNEEDTKELFDILKKNKPNASITIKYIEFETLPKDKRIYGEIFSAIHGTTRNNKEVNMTWELINEIILESVGLEEIDEKE